MPDDTYQPISADVTVDAIMSVRQQVSRQNEGMGLRVGKNAEFTLIAPVLKGGADLFRSRHNKLQTEAAYWESKLGTVQNVRIMLVNNDSQILFAASYSDDFKPYVLDVIKFAQPWIDHMFVGVAEGFPGLASPEAVAYINRYQVESAIWFVAHPNLTVRDVSKADRVLLTLNSLFDAVQS